MKTILTCTKEYDGTYKITLSDKTVVYSSREYRQGITVKVTNFMGMTKIEEVI